MDKGAFSAARRASGPTVGGAARACGASRPTTAARERRPLGFRLSEPRAPCAAMGPRGRRLPLDAVGSAWED